MLSKTMLQYNYWKTIQMTTFLAHLGLRLKWAILIKICPLSVVVVALIVVVVNFSHFHLLRNHWANFYLIRHKASLGEGDSRLFKWRTPPFCKGENYEIAKIYINEISKTSPEPLGQFHSNLTTKHLWVKGTKFVQMKTI